MKKTPTTTKQSTATVRNEARTTFAFKPKEKTVLESIAKRDKTSQIAVIRRGILLAKQHPLSTPQTGKKLV